MDLRCYTVGTFANLLQERNTVLPVKYEMWPKKELTISYNNGAKSTVNLSLK
jgi:hypothetical protein